MDKNTALEVAAVYAKLIRARFNCISILLFGSYSRGNFTADSDIDIAVVIDDYDSFDEVQMELMRLRRKIDSRIEPHPFRKNDFTSSNPLVHEIMQYGQEVI